MALQHLVMQGLIDANCPKDASSYDAAIAIAEALRARIRTPHLSLQSHVLCSIAAISPRPSVSAIRRGRQAAREPSFASFMAMICFRSFRFAKSRHYARLALRAEPGHPVATELLVLTRLVWFPPFLLAHALLFLAAQVNCNRLFGAIALPSIFLLALLAFLLIPVKPEAVLPIGHSDDLLLRLQCDHRQDRGVCTPEWRPNSPAFGILSKDELRPPDQLSDLPDMT